MQENAKRDGGVQSLEVGLGVLNVLVQANAPLMLKQVAALTNMPPAKAHRYLVSLVRFNYAKQNSDGLYLLGDKALALGLAATRRSDVLQSLQASLQGLQNQIGGYLQVTKWSNLGPLVVQFWDDEFGVPISAKVGAIMPLLRSATGRVFASYLPKEVWQDLALQEGFCTVAEFETHKKRVLQQQMCAVEGEMMVGINAMAAPVFDGNGDLALVVTCLGRDSQIDVTENSLQWLQFKQALEKMNGVLNAF